MLENPFSSNKKYDAVILAVPHDIFMNQKNRIVELVNRNGLVVDLVSGLDRSELESLGKTYWSL
jgi:glycerol-3-phosphate dehydrogenase